MWAKLPYSYLQLHRQPTFLSLASVSADCVYLRPECGPLQQLLTAEMVWIFFAEVNA